MRRRVRFIFLILLIGYVNLVFASQENNSQEEDNSVTQQEEVVTLRVIPEEHWHKIKTDRGFIYSKPKPPKPPKKVDLSWLKTISPILRILLYILIALCIGVILYSILRNSEFSYFRKAKKKEKLVEGNVEDLYHYEDWENTLEEAIAQKNFRLGIRILYLQTLHLLDQQHRIQYKQDKTNWDYVLQLRTTPYAEQFTQLTKYFDYVWYGHFMVDEDGFQRLRDSFREFQKELET